MTSIDDLARTTCSVDEWPIVKQFFPAHWQEMARETGAIKRSMRSISGPESLLRVLLIHLAGGCSLKESVKRASLAGIAEISHVALHKRLRASGEWFRRMALELRDSLRLEAVSSSRRLLAIDASAISEPGATGTDCLVHYSLDICSLSCDQYILTDQKGGERLTRFTIQVGDVYICDRAYGTIKSIRHARAHSADIITRIRENSSRLWNPDGRVIDLETLFCVMKAGEVASWAAAVGQEAEARIEGRLVCIARSRDATKVARNKIIQEASRKCREPSARSLALAPYFFLWTSLGKEEADDRTILNWYKLRWQVELAFKRMKSIMDLGHLPKTGQDTAHAWLQGKLFIGLLLERIHVEARSFSPWGFPLIRAPQPMEGGLVPV